MSESRSKSKFAGLLDAARDREPDAEDLNKPQIEPEVTGGVGEPAHVEPTVPPVAMPDEVPAVSSRGRPRGKRSDPDYEQVTAYVRRDTYKDVRRELLDRDGEFSELVEELLSAWLKR